MMHPYYSIPLHSMQHSFQWEFTELK